MNISPLKFIITYWKYALAALVVVALGWYFSGGKNGENEASLVVEQADFKQHVSVSGTVVAARSADLGFAQSGRVVGTYVAVGEHVNEGVLLAQTENGDFVAVLERAKANLANLLSGTRKEELALAVAEDISARATLLDSIRSAYAASDSAVHNSVDLLFNTADSLYVNPRPDLKVTFNVSDDNLRLRLERNRAITDGMLDDWEYLMSNASADPLVLADSAQVHISHIINLLADASSAVAKAYPDQTTTASVLSSYATAISTARTSVNAAAASLTTARAALVSAQKNLILKQAGATPEQITAARADVSNAEADINKTRITAPFSGVVTRMDAKVGEVVSPSTPVITLQSDAIFQIETFVPEVVISRIGKGNSAKVELDAYGSSVSFAAKVIDVEPAETIKDGVPTYKTMLVFLESNSRIRSGMTANVLIETGTLENAIVIPSGAVITRGNNHTVLVVNEDGVEERPVTLGASPALGQAQVLSGLSSGEKILLSGATSGNK